MNYWEGGFIKQADLNPWLIALFCVRGLWEAYVERNMQARRHNFWCPIVGKDKI